MIYNVKYATDPILIVAGDYIDFWLHVEEYDDTTETWSDMDLTGVDLHFKIWNNHSTELVDWNTDDATLVLDGTSDLNVLADPISNISCCGSFEGQLYIDDPRRTLWKGIVKIV